MKLLAPALVSSSLLLLSSPREDAALLDVHATRDGTLYRLEDVDAGLRCVVEVDGEEHGFAVPRGLLAHGHRLLDARIRPLLQGEPRDPGGLLLVLVLEEGERTTYRYALRETDGEWHRTEPFVATPGAPFRVVAVEVPNPSGDAFEVTLRRGDVWRRGEEVEELVLAESCAVAPLAGARLLDLGAGRELEIGALLE